MGFTISITDIFSGNPMTLKLIQPMLAKSRLSMGCNELAEAGELLDLEVAVVTGDALMENMERKVLHHLRENELAGVHGSPLRTLLCEDGWTSGKISSR